MKIYLDLLPKQRRSELVREKFFRRILHQEFLFLLPIILFIVILCNIYYLLTVQRDISLLAKSQVESQDKYQELGVYEEKFKQVNTNSAKLLKIQAGHLHWAEILNKFTAVTPAEISITNFSTKDFQILLVGKAKSRDALLSFKNNLEADQCFTDINVPLSNLVVRDNIDFQMDFSVKQDCLKKQ